MTSSALRPSPTAPAHPREVRLGMGNKERQAEMDTRQEKKKALWRQLQETERKLRRLISSTRGKRKETLSSQTTLE